MRSSFKNLKSSIKASLTKGGFVVLDGLKRARGFTLLEVLISLGIIAGAYLLVLSSLGGSGNELRRTAQHMIQIIRYSYEQAALNYSYYRLVFDFEEQKYFVEFSSEPFFIVKEDDKAELIRKENEERNQEDDLGFDSTVTNDEDEVIYVEEEAAEAAGQGNFEESEDDFLEIFELPENIQIRDIYVAHQNAPLSEGKAYLYFFPRGQTEFTVIHLSDEDGENILALVVNPLTASVQVFDKEQDYEELLEAQENEK
ncbi:MAG: type II secretion system protein [Deltaproteobacteria bacterium]|nr:type II secretion system protein [Deltaproteobacteria bacterium]